MIDPERGWDRDGCWSSVVTRSRRGRPVRGFIKFIFWTVGILIALNLSFNLASAVDPRTDRGQTSMTVFVVLMVLAIAILFFLSRKLGDVGRVNTNPWLSAVGDCKYKHAWDGTGIAVDEADGCLHLLARFNGIPVAKTYPLSDVRSWRFEMPDLVIERGGAVIGGGITGASRNLGYGIGQSIANSVRESRVIENTGLYVDVRDIDHPQWFIKFRSRTPHDKSTEMELRRWMEILAQHVNG
jgi:hypothetical protein